MSSPQLGIRIREYQSKDLDACRQLWVELTEWHRHIYDEPSIGGSNPGRKFDEHLARIGPANIWVAESEGSTIGMVGLIPNDKEAELEPLVVSPSHRGSGVGRRLVETVLEAARHRGLQVVTTRPVARNREAIQFFHDRGFNILGQLELFIEIVPRKHKPWKTGETLAGEEFLF